MQLVNWFALIIGLVGIWWGFTVATKPADIARSWGLGGLASSQGAMLLARILGAFLVALAAFILLRSFDSGIDDCLDAGGAWNDVTRTCEGKR
jgi:hypothetical protein